MKGMTMDHDRPIRIGDGTYWVGVKDAHSPAPFNAYLIIDGGEAVLIDGGGRSGFASVVIKILQSGITPSAIKRLVFQNYNSRYTGSLPHLQDLIDREDLQIISDRNLHRFLQNDCKPNSLLSLEEIGFKFRFSSGRCLEFIQIPFAHAAGSFVTFDPKNKILFSGDLFGCYTSAWNLFLKLTPRCHTCIDYTHCPEGRSTCPIFDIVELHRTIIASERSLRCALDRISTLPFMTIAPQHGSIIDKPHDILFICELLSTLKNVGIDGIIGDRSFLELGDIGPIRKRLGNA